MSLWAQFHSYITKLRSSFDEGCFYSKAEIVRTSVYKHSRMPKCMCTMYLTLCLCRTRIASQISWMTMIWRLSPRQWSRDLHGCVPTAIPLMWVIFSCAHAHMCIIICTICIRRMHLRLRCWCKLCMHARLCLHVHVRIHDCQSITCCIN